jgi:ABC-type transporter Mla subunit MlaD
MMSNQDFNRGAANTRSQSDDWSAKAKDAMSTASSAAGDAAGKVKQAASDTAETLTGEAKELLNRQLGGGADMLGYVARSARRAAEDLERDSPQFAGMVRTMASRVDGYANSLRGQSIEQMWQSAADLTRRQPALVFGVTALAGFFVLRTLKSAPPLKSPSLQPYHPDYRGGSYGS